MQPEPSRAPSSPKPATRLPEESNFRTCRRRCVDVEDVGVALFARGFGDGDGAGFDEGAEGAAEGVFGGRQGGIGAGLEGGDEAGGAAGAGEVEVGGVGDAVLAEPARSSGERK